MKLLPTLLIVLGLKCLHAEEPVPKAIAFQSESVALADDMVPPSPDASAAEKFLHELSKITQQYLLETSYTVEWGNVFADTYWTNERAQAVIALLKSPVGQNAPEPLRASCIKALKVDAALLKTGESFGVVLGNGQREGQRLMSEMIIGFIQDVPIQIQNTARSMTDPWAKPAGDPILDRLFAQTLGLALQTYAGIERTKALAVQLRQMKQDGALHRQWAELLAKMAESDPALKPYANEPRITDPSWQFMRMADGIHETGEVYFGQSVVSRAKERRAPVLDSAGDISLGNLADGAVHLHVSSTKPAFAKHLAFKLPPGEDAVVSLKCEQGHFGILLAKGNLMRTSLWAARGGVADSINHGRRILTAKVGDCKYPIYLLHLPTTGHGEDAEAEGDCLIYLRRQYASDEAALQGAKLIEVR